MFVHSSVSNCVSIELMIVHVLKYRTVSVDVLDSVEATPVPCIHGELPKLYQSCLKPGLQDTVYKTESNAAHSQSV